MPKASLLLRETLSSSSLTNIVEKSQKQKPPYFEYDIKFNSSKLDLFLLKSSPPQKYQPLGIPQPQDEGFESDIDSLSLISSDESFTSSTCLVDDHVLKHQLQETDSANGSSSSSDSDTEQTSTKESFPLNDVLCYTDVTNPKVLVFVVKDDVFVFSFDNLDLLNNFYTSFNTLKAVTNQRTYGNNVNLGAKFNLLQRTDSNGVTHIEISRDFISHSGATSVDDSKIYLQNERKSSRSEFLPNVSINSYTLKPRSSASTLNLKEEPLKKSWKSAEDLLNEPKRPERKRKPKGRAPQPPIQQPQIPQPLKQQPPKQQPSNVMKGQYVRVSVDPKKPPEKPPKPPNFHTFSSNIQTFTPNWNNIQTSSIIEKKREYRKNEETTMRHPHSWTNSVPRLLRKRSKSETRQPLAYRYIQLEKQPENTTISNRLFGLSQKLKEFGNNVVVKEPRHSFTSYYDPPLEPLEQRRNSIGEMTYKKNSHEANKNLKSVIKKDDNDKKKSEKKVTFSAYATVQVV